MSTDTTQKLKELSHELNNVKETQLFYDFDSMDDEFKWTFYFKVKHHMYDKIFVKHTYDNKVKIYFHNREFYAYVTEYNDNLWEICDAYTYEDVGDYYGGDINDTERLKDFLEKFVN